MGMYVYVSSLVRKEGTRKVAKPFPLTLFKDRLLATSGKQLTGDMIINRSHPLNYIFLTSSHVTPSQYYNQFHLACYILSIPFIIIMIAINFQKNLSRCVRFMISANEPDTQLLTIRICRSRRNFPWWG